MDVAVKPSSSSQSDRGTMPISLLANRPSGWAQYRFEDLFAIPRQEREELQLAAIQYRFEQLKDAIPALERLVAKQGVKRIDSITDALPLFFDHRVYKSYPLSLIENRDFPKLTAWLNRLTLHDLTRMDLTGVKTVDDWCDRLESYGMIVGHSTGTTGKLSFIPRSLVEWPAWQATFNQTSRAATGLDPTKDHLPTFFPGYRSGHHMMLKMLNLFIVPAAGGWEHWHTLYPTRVSADLMSLAGRMAAAEEKGDLMKLLGPELMQKRDEMIAQGRRREQDLNDWFTKLIRDFKGKRVRINGPFSDLLRVSLAGREKGIKCEFAPGSIIMSGGGMKGYKDPPPNWKEIVLDFFGIDNICQTYGMSEVSATAPMCKCGFFHFMPSMVPILLDKDANELPREGVQTGRMALFDLLAETYWGGFISGDQVTVHWDEDCACGWKGPRITQDIQRFAQMEGGDDKITCAGSAQAYNEFMEYVMQV